MSEVCKEYVTCDDKFTIRQPKTIAEITICGFMHFTVTDECGFIRPTEEQIKNLHDLLCIDVKLLDE